MVLTYRRRALATEVVRGLLASEGLSPEQILLVVNGEGGLTDPSTETLRRLIGAAGFDIRAGLTPAPTLDPHVLDDVARILSLTPEQRLEEVAHLARFAWSARRV